MYLNYQEDIDLIPDHFNEHNYSTIKQINHIDIDQQYADDISKITSNYSAILKLKAELPQKLAKRGLLINESKTEEYTSRNKNSCNLKWKKMQTPWKSTRQ